MKKLMEELLYLSKEGMNEDYLKEDSSGENFNLMFKRFADQTTAVYFNANIVSKDPANNYAYSRTTALKNKGDKKFTNNMLSIETSYISMKYRLLYLEKILINGTNDYSSNEINKLKEQLIVVEQLIVRMYGNNNYFKDNLEAFTIKVKKLSKLYRDFIFFIEKKNIISKKRKVVMTETFNHFLRNSRNLFPIYKTVFFKKYRMNGMGLTIKRKLMSNSFGIY